MLHAIARSLRCSSINVWFRDFCLQPHQSPSPARSPSNHPSKGPFTPLSQTRIPRRAVSAHTLRSSSSAAYRATGGAKVQPRSPLAVAVAPSPHQFHHDLTRTVRMIFEEESRRGGAAGAAARGYLRVARIEASSGMRPTSPGGVGAGLRPSRLVGAIPQPMHLSRPATAGGAPLVADLRFE